jgi:hypothetical protein
MNNKIAGLPKIKRIFDNPAFLCGMEFPDEIGER